MEIFYPTNFPDYELLDCGKGYRLERFGKYLLSRPDPQAIWEKSLPQSEWDKAQAIFKRTSADKGFWEKHGTPDYWLMNWNNLKFYCRLTPFKHTGVFPEQAVHWEWLQKKIQDTEHRVQNTQVLNLFGYTGLSTMACAESGAKVTHVDASKPAITWAKENQQVSGLASKPVRWILDDALEFTRREVRRGVKYDGIIMDPPVYGHGPPGKTWDISKSLPELLHTCKELLSDTPKFILINAYAVSFSAQTLENLLADLKLGGKISSGELALKQNNSERLLSTGIWAKWES